MSLSYTELPRDYIGLPAGGNLEFALTISEAKLGPDTKSRLNKKRELYEEEKTKPLSNKVIKQIAHVLLMPYTLPALALQTISDIALVAIAALATVFTLGLHERSRHELKCRAYNLFVVDSLSALLIVPSLIYKPAYTWANSLHLGTTCSIDQDINFLPPPPPPLTDNDTPEY